MRARAKAPGAIVLARHSGVHGRAGASAERGHGVFAPIARARPGCSPLRRVHGRRVHAAHTGARAAMLPRFLVGASTLLQKTTRKLLSHDSPSFPRPVTGQSMHPPRPVNGRRPAGF